MKKEIVLTPHVVVEYFMNQVPKDGNEYYFVADSYYGSYNLAITIHKAGYKFIFLCKGDGLTPLWKRLESKVIEKKSWIKR